MDTLPRDVGVAENSSPNRYDLVPAEVVGQPETLLYCRASSWVLAARRARLKRPQAQQRSQKSPLQMTLMKQADRAQVLHHATPLRSLRQ